ncbi:MAG: hypothetical protein AAF372_00515 [Pseudomonadota bacterium]
MIKLFTICLLTLIINQYAIADDCTFTADGGSLEELNQCPSFVNADKSQMRFARIDSVDGDQVFIGPSRYTLASDVEIFDPELFSPTSGNCVSAEGNSAVAAHVGMDVAMILEDVGQLEDRQIKSIWLLNCDITQGR